jgi:hypothetical protein
MTDGALVTTYWRYYELFTSEDRAERLAAVDWSWASEQVDQTVREGGSGAVDLLVALADVARDEPARAYLGAGPVERFVRQHGEAFHTELEAASRQNTRFAEVLRYVWGA